VRYPQRRFEARRFCPQQGMVLMWIGLTPVKRTTYRLHYAHCVCEGNGCDPTRCPLGRRQKIRILNQPYRPRVNQLPLFIKRRNDHAAS
jgi:hypothetical protein